MEDPKANIREDEEPLSIPSPLSVEEVVEMELALEDEQIIGNKEGAPSQEAQVQGLEDSTAGPPPSKEKEREVVMEGGALPLQQEPKQTL